MFKQTQVESPIVGEDKRLRRKLNLTEYATTHSSFSGELNWYTTPPSEEISIEDFETFALDRLQVLRALEAALIRNKTPEETVQIYHRVSNQHQLSFNILSALNKEQILRKDLVSHYILRLAFCRSEDLRRWFVKYEVLLFQIKYNQAKAETKEKFISMLGAKFERVSEQEKQQLRAPLNASKFGGFGEDFDKTTFLKVPFERVPSLVGSRQVYLKTGYAYVPCEYSLSWITEEFRLNLERGLLDLYKALPQLDEDERLLPVLDACTKKSFSAYDISESQKVAGQVEAKDVIKLERHFPLCMRNLFAALKRDQHLKHNGRMQFGLFLKGIGLSLDQALEFWRMAFVRTSDEDFKKRYAYNIRHNYGQEGNRKNYSPMGCDKIINLPPGGPDQHHGCPFQQFNPERLNSEIRALNPAVTDGELKELKLLVSGKHYNLACSKYFELTHPSTNPQAPTSLSEPISHPNQYFELSYKFTTSAPQST